MKITTPALLGILLLALTASPARAEKEPRPGSADSRVKTVVYHETDVYKLKTHYGFTTTIELSSRERIDTISLGDTEAWEVVNPKSRANVLIVKPLEENASTNMNVITSKRTYTFEMSATKADSPESEDLTFRLKFIYPTETAMDLANIGGVGGGYDPLSDKPVGEWNFDYSYAGDRDLRPERVFDDGAFTYFQFQDAGAVPAIFAVDTKGNESIVNFTVQGPYLVVKKLARQFTLRDGDISTCIFNETWPEPAGKQKSAAPVETLKERKPTATKKTTSKTKTAKKKGKNTDGSLLAFFKSSGSSKGVYEMQGR